MDKHPEERKASPEHGSVSARRWPSLSAAAAAVCLALSLSALATCCLTVIKTREMESRVLALERMTDRPVTEELRDSVRSLVQEALSELKPKLRPARDVTHECVCPPGPPGKRGRMGRRGDPGPPVSTSLLYILSVSHSLPVEVCRVCV
ncbi:collagen alpha-1(XXIII) chain-like [Hemibagrus wyckioides]|uniref:collagen alpha-1(XXIII) chain-like n=1 Tax=Hemibagrus wyckioides TaxID=337641 RepID=UPI00266CFD6E|nr:collagen alpha-1(XXIII) chain-like [Hemibagrus wyckioides]